MPAPNLEIEQLHRIRAALNAHAMVAETNLDGEIFYANDAFCTVTGYTREEILGLNPRVLNSGHHPREFFEGLWRTITSGKTWHGEIRNRRKDGGIFWRDTTIVPSLDPDGKPISYMVIGYDITARYEQTEALRQALKRAEELAEAAQAATRAKAEFLANMSHEIRTPLNAIIGMSELLQGADLRAEQAEFAETIHNSGEALLTLINDILDFSKIESGRIELENVPFVVRECLESTLDLAARQAALKGLELLLWIKESVPLAIQGDPFRLRQVLVNLVNNAVKFTSSGQVLLTVDVIPEQPDSPARLHFSVRDTGIGIPDDRRDRLFKAFSQVDASTTREFGGTGLGLAICDRLITTMGGHIWVDTAPDKGSDFQFTIPLRGAPQLPSSASCGPEPRLKGRRVLIVDDNPTNLRILDLQTSQWGVSAVTVGSGTDALRLLADDQRFDAVILDMQMSGVDGCAVARSIKDQTALSGLPLIALCSLDDTLSPGQRELFDRVLTKPTKAVLLRDSLCALIKPADADHAASLATVECAPERRRGLKILLAEDDPVNQRVARMLLRRIGYECSIVSNGEETIDAISRTPFDIILLDVHMPKLDGLRTAARLRATIPEQRRPWIIAMTANALKGDRETCIDAGMDDYISKPIATQTLQRALKHACGELAMRRGSEHDPSEA